MAVLHSSRFRTLAISCTTPDTRNAIANFTFLTQETNLEVSKRDPAEYFPQYEGQTPGSIASHWIPMDPSLWKIENYPEFLAKRRKLLAEAANEFLEKLANGNVPDPVDIDETDFIGRAAEHVPGSIDSDKEEARLILCNNWAVKNGLPAGELGYELADQDGKQLAILDLAWPDGVPPGLTQAVAVLIDEGDDVEDAASLAGFRCFSSASAFRKYVRDEVLYQNSETVDELEAVEQ